MLQNIMEHVCTFENLYQAYLAARKGKRYRDETLAFTQNLERNLFDLQAELLGGTYTVGPYREFYVRYPKPRLVMALQFRDRVVQHAIYRQLNPYIDRRYIDDSFACREGRGALAAVERLLYWERQIIRKPNGSEWYCLKLDISKYFYRVDHEIILQLIGRLTDDARFIRLMDIIVNNPDVPFGLPEGMRADECPPEERLYEVGMPIGNLSSQMVANLYLHQLDMFVKHRLGAHFYIRYMDDAIILSDDLAQLHRWRAQIEAFLVSELRLKLNRKTAIQRMSSGIEFVGRVVTPSGLRIRKSTRTRIKRVLRHLAEEYRRGEIDVDDVLPVLGSYFGLMKHADTYNLRKWISENIVFARSAPEPSAPIFMQDEPEPEWWEHIQEAPPADWRDAAWEQEIAPRRGGCFL